MESFEQRLAQDSKIRVVRWPFRIFAGLLLLAVCIALFGGIYRLIETPTVTGAFLVVLILPLALVIRRTVGCVIRKGRVPGRLYWPFPSGLLLFMWIALFGFTAYLASHA